MSSRSVEGSPSRRYEERPPLRSLENEKQHLSTPPRRKSKSLMKADVCLGLCSPPPANVTQTIKMGTFGPVDLTFQSFICSGGEVMISEEPSLCTEDHIFLPQDQTVGGTCEKDDMGTSETCSIHMEHPYCHPERTDPAVVEIIPANTESDSSELKVSAGSRQPGETVPLVMDGEHVDNPNDCQREGALSAICDVTFKSFTCAGVEVEIPNVTKVVDETVPLPAEQTVTSHSELSFLPADVHLCSEHFDHPYFRFETNVDTFGQEAALLSAFVAVPGEQAENSQLLHNESLIVNHVQSSQNDDKAVTLTPASDKTLTHHSVSLKVQDGFDDEIPPVTEMFNETFPLPEEQIASGQSQPQILPAEVKECGDLLNCHFEKNLLDPHIETKTENCGQVAGVPEEQTSHSEFLTKNQTLTMDPIQVNPNDDVLGTSTPSSEKTLAPESVYLKIRVTPERVDDGKMVPEGQLNLDFSQSSEAKDSALGLSENRPHVPSPVGEPLTETLPTVLKVLSERPSVVSALQLISPIRRASLTLARACRNPADHCEKNPLSPDGSEMAALWTDHLESPLPHPLFNSTTLCNKLQPEGPQPEDLGKKNHGSALPDGPLIPDGPLQQQLRQMAEFLLLASGKIDFAAPPAKSCGVGVGITPVKMLDRSLNTSGEFERKSDLSNADACTLTDPLPLMWNCPAGSLDSVPREELEQRLTSSTVMVEALVQQLAVARALCAPSAGPPPSQLRNKLVQTDHTELSQTTMYRDLYMAALDRIGNLEEDGRSVQELIRYMQEMRVTMASLTGDTDAALSDMKQTEALVREDHRRLASHFGEMKLLYTKFKEMQTRMTEKVDEAFRQRDEMKTRMEDAQTSKEAAFSTVEQVRTRCAGEMAALRRSVGSQQELLAALNVTFPQLVALNKTNSETLSSASNLLCQTMQDHSSLTNELSLVRSLVLRTAPLLVRLNEKAAAALRERDEHMSARDQAQEEKEQLQEELRKATFSLQTAEEQIGDLSLQVNILTSEMSVLRQKLKEGEEQRAQLERTMTEMSATVSSTTAAHTFLEHTLAEETSRLQQAQRDASMAEERADNLASSLGQAEEWADELSRDLAEKEEDLRRLRELSQSQSSQIQQLRGVCAQLGAAAEMNEFLQAENEVAREQLAESEDMLRVLHERNIQCEDLKADLSQLERERKSVQEELEATRVKARTSQRKRSEELAQAVTEITLLHHTLRVVTNKLHDVLGGEKPEPNNSQPALKVEQQQPSSSFVDCVTVALTAEKNDDEEEETKTTDVSTDSPRESIFSENSAFTRLPVTPKKKNPVAREFDEDEKEEQSGVPEVLAHLSDTVTELVGALESVQRQKDARAEELQHAACSLEMALQDTNSKHRAEVSELKHQLSCLRRQAERREQALQQQAQDSKMITKLMNDVTEAQELMLKHRIEYNELRKETTELCRSLQQSETEIQILRAELRKAGTQTTGEVDEKEEKLLLLKEVERLKTSLQETEQTRGKLLERAKRHQQIQQINQQKCENEVRMLNNMMNKVRETLLSLPEVVKNCEQLQQLLEYLG
ncbi:sperm-associated antigen 5 [Hippocampus comes]|uniref:Sperm associated antigen 5 n=1 Tax=Hippocampus comes TaxID=109280 RepID=A0A3Q3D5J8_HIPCM|nr:PREDICTED: sperm-associated antigen 5 [Hippocampus comes]